MIKIPDIILEECPLPDGFWWRDADKRDFAGIWDAEAEATTHAIRDAAQDEDPLHSPQYDEILHLFIEGRFGRSNVKMPHTEFDSIEAMCRWLYAQFLMRG